ncbi:Protein THYLAKOID ASSEMBLY 8-like, chloroplastic [Linum perenne]
MAIRAFSRSSISRAATSSLLQNTLRHPTIPTPACIESPIPSLDSYAPTSSLSGFRQYHDGRPRGPLWRGKKLIGKEALFVIMGLKRFKDEEEKLDKFIKTHVNRLLKLDMVAVVCELERQDEVSLAVKIFQVIQKQDWGFLRDGSPADAMNVYEDMKQSPDPPEELPFRILLKGLLPHPLLRNRVKQDYEELFPEKNVFDPPEEIFGIH